MAKYLPGVAVSSVSGSIGGTVFSRNRGGQYIRNRSIPSVVRTEKALAQKAIFSLVSQAWVVLTDAQRLAWRIYGQSQTKTDRLGKSISLTGQALFIGLNARLLSAGNSAVNTPPVTSAPAGIVPSAFTVDSGSGDTELAFAVSPLPAGVKLWIRGAKVASSAVVNIENLLTTVLITDAAATTPVDLETALIDAFGALQTGATYVIECRTLDTASGLVSGKVYARTLCVESA